MNHPNLIFYKEFLGDCDWVQVEGELTIEGSSYVILLCYDKSSLLIHLAYKFLNYGFLNIVDWFSSDGNEVMNQYVLKNSVFLPLSVSENEISIICDELKNFYSFMQEG